MSTQPLNESAIDPLYTVDRNVLIYAFRYCLGRMTYAVSIMSDTLIQHADTISAADKALIVGEINEAIERGHAGMACDVQAWQKVVARFGPAYRVTLSHNGEVETVTAYQTADGRYWQPPMTFYLAPEYIVSVEPL